MSLCLPVLAQAAAVTTRSYDSQIQSSGSFADLIAWWKGNAAADSKGLFGSGTMPTGGVIFNAEPIPAGAELPSSSFNTAGEVHYGHPAALTNLDQGTIVVVLRPSGNSLQTHSGVIARLQEATVPPLGGSRRDMRIMWENFNLEWAISTNESLPPNKAVYPYGLSESAIQCVAVSWGPIGMRLMVDGDLLASHVYAGSAPIMSGRDWLHGAAGFAGGISNRYGGLMAHVQLYRAQLSTEQMRALMPKPMPRVARPAVFNNAGATSYDNDFTVSGRTNRKLIVILGRDSANTLTNVRWKGSAGTPMTVVEEVTVGNLLLRVYQLTDPSSGSGTVFYQASIVNDVFCMVLEMVHVDQGPILVPGTHGTSSTTTTSITLPSVRAGSLCLSAMLQASGGITSTSTGDGTTILGLADGYGPGGFWRASVRQVSPVVNRDVTFSYSFVAADAVAHIAMVFPDAAGDTGVIPGDPGPATFTEDWNYTGSWSAAKWSGLGFTGTSVIEATGTEGRMAAQGTTGTYHHVRISCLATAMTDFELTATFRMAGAGEQYHALNFRTSGGWSAATPVRPFNGYHLTFYNDGVNQRVQLQPSLSGGLVGTPVFATKTWGTGTWNLRLQAEGSSIRVRVWQGVESTTWDIDALEPTYDSGTFQWAAGNGNAITTRTIFWDNLLIVPGVAGGGVTYVDPDYVDDDYVE